ncbi:MAG: ABC transporter ATP-binding protein, partial [Gammaproteobacteria bacterium]|nr:ABC transporter ATP-binding protein [Gammaproteobacteria bacterium]
MHQDKPDTTKAYTWQSIFAMTRQHKALLIKANIIAVFATIVSVPVPLLMPLLVDEVLLDQPGKIIELLSLIFPQQWLTPVSIIAIVMLLSMALRLVSLLLAVWQTREFTRVAKDVTYRIRLSLLQHLQKVSMAEYEAAGSGSITSHLVTDVTTIDDFLGASLSKFIVALLTVTGVAVVLLWMHWQLALFILLMNP